MLKSNAVALTRLAAIVKRERRAGSVHTAAYIEATYLKPLQRQTRRGHKRPRHR